MDNTKIVELSKRWRWIMKEGNVRMNQTTSPFPLYPFLKNFERWQVPSLDFPVDRTLSEEWSDDYSPFGDYENVILWGGGQDSWAALHILETYYNLSPKNTAIYYLWWGAPHLHKIEEAWTYKFLPERWYTSFFPENWPILRKENLLDGKVMIPMRNSFLAAAALVRFPSARTIWGGFHNLPCRFSKVVNERYEMIDQTLAWVDHISRILSMTMKRPVHVTGPSLSTPLVRILIDMALVGSEYLRPALYSYNKCPRHFLGEVDISEKACGVCPFCQDRQQVWAEVHQYSSEDFSLEIEEFMNLRFENTETFYKTLDS